MSQLTERSACTAVKPTAPHRLDCAASHTLYCAAPQVIDTVWQYLHLKRYGRLLYRLQTDMGVEISTVTEIDKLMAQAEKEEAKGRWMGRRVDVAHDWHA